MAYAHGKDYIPTRDADFDKFFKKICQYVTQKTSGANPEWPNIPAADVTSLNAAYAAWYTAFSKTLGEHSSEDTKQKTRVRKESEHVLRAFYVRYLKFVSAHDKDEMDLPETDGTKTPIGRPTEHVRLFVEPVHALEHKIGFECEETGKKAIPYGYDGVVLAQRALEPTESVPTDPEDLTSTRLLTRHNVTITHPSKDQGKRCAYAGCWQNKKGEKGNWSQIVVVIIP